MPKKKKKGKKKKYNIDNCVNPTAYDLFREAKEQEKNQDEYWGI